MLRQSAMNASICCVVLLLSASFAAATDITFEDSTFGDAEWTATIATGPIDGQTAVQIADGGNSGTNPDPFRSVTTNTNSLVSTAHTNSAYVYDPSTGAITSLDFSIDYMNISFFGQGQSFGLAVEQDGIFYTAGGDITGPGGFLWNTFVREDIEAVDFQRADFSPGTPDFSSTGNPITFGFRTSNSGGNTIEVGYDNWSVTIHAIPEPGSLSILALTALGLLSVRRQRCT